MSLRVGIYQHPDIPQSFKVYADNVVANLSGMDIQITPFSGKNDLPKTADVLWDIRSGGGNPPLEFMLNGPPLVMTVHGFAPMSLSGWEYFKTVKGMLMSRQYTKEKHARWRALRDGVASVIAVSEFTRGEVIRHAGIPDEKIVVAMHGVDATVFYPKKNGSERGYFLHVSNNEPRKNVDRIVSAFQKLEFPATLKLKLPKGQGKQYAGIKGVEVIDGFLDDGALAKLYQNACCFVFPSLYEGFGMPILEAMACGTRVITSNVTACSEVAGDAAMLVDPRSVDHIASAMQVLFDEPGALSSVHAKGIERALQFGWRESAWKHAEALHMATQRAINTKAEVFVNP